MAAGAELPAWPALFTPPAELLGWLHQQDQHAGPRSSEERRHWRTLRWLVLAELDRTAPEVPTKPAPPGF